MAFGSARMSAMLSPWVSAIRFCRETVDAVDAIDGALSRPSYNESYEWWVCYCYARSLLHGLKVPWFLCHNFSELQINVSPFYIVRCLMALSTKAFIKHPMVELTSPSPPALIIYNRDILKSKLLGDIMKLSELLWLWAQVRIEFGETSPLMNTTYF